MTEKEERIYEKAYREKLREELIKFATRYEGQSEDIYYHQRMEEEVNEYLKRNE